MTEILFVSNDPKNIDIVAEIAGEMGYAMRVCFSPKQAQSTLFIERSVSVLVIDCSSIQPGDQMVAGMLKSAKSRSVPAIAMIHSGKAYAANGSGGEDNTLAEEINFAVLLRDVRTLNPLAPSRTEQLAIGS